jgi:hypothetical protein
MPFEFVTAMPKGRVGSLAIKGGDAQSGTLQAHYEGKYPSGYSSMKNRVQSPLALAATTATAPSAHFMQVP